MPVVWTVTPETALGQLADDYIRRIEAGIVAIADHYAPIIEAEMKSNHPWQNRTGNAEAGLHTEVNHIINQMVEIILAHGVEYGIWLEVKFAGRDSVLAPTLDIFGPRVWADVVRLLS